MIMIAIFLIGLLAKTMLEKDLDVTNYATSSTVRAEASDIMAHAVNLRMAVENILRNGVDPADIDDIPPNDSAYNDAPHVAKIYHPYGGGASYSDHYGGWRDIIIHDNVTITDMGPTNQPELVVAGNVAAAVCRELAQDMTPVQVNQTVLDNILSGNAVTLSDGSVCQTGSCDSVAYNCLRNSGATQHVFYFLLHAR